jgi:acyl carrier protein
MLIEELIEKLEIEFELSKNSLIPSTSFRELEDWSSMHALILIALVDTEYSVTINGEDLQSIITVTDLYNLILTRIK